MCIAIMKSENKKISKASLQRCYDANPDGAGFMFAEDKELHVQKGYFTFKEFYKAYKPHEDKQVLLHFRIKTHGKIDKTNCHPFLVNNGLGFIHNGIISGYGDDKESDTIAFNNSILKKIVAKHGNMGLFEDPMVELIENVIGYSKLVFLDRHGNYQIMNEEKGHWNNGVWYSNNSYKKPEPLPTKYYNWDKYNKFNNQNTPPSLLSSSDCKHREGDWIVCTEQYVHGKGDKSHVVKKGEWFEVEQIKGKKATIVDGDYTSPFVLENVPVSVIDKWEDAETYSWNKSFDF